jgi:DNA-binding MarR family transcriptional regulator
VFDATANRLGALALVLADEMGARAAEACGMSPSAAAALSAMYEDIVAAPSIDRLAAVLGLTSSGTVRLVDGLVQANFVERRRGRDGRVSVIGLTDAGSAAARRVALARAEMLEAALSALAESERVVFGELLTRVLTGIGRMRIQEPQGARGWMCRLCDKPTCGGLPGQPCPVTLAALQSPDASSK